MKRSERIAAVIMSLAGVMIMYYAWSVLKLGTIHVPDAGLLPFLCGVGLTILSLVWLVVLQKQPEPETGEKAELRYRLRPYLSLALMIVYAWTLEALGYITSTLIFMIVWQQIIEREKWVKTIIITVLGTAAMYALFSMFLKVPIPAEFFLR